MNLTREKVDHALDVELTWCDTNTQDGMVVLKGGSFGRTIWRFTPAEHASYAELTV